MRSHTPLSADQNCGVSAPRSDNDDCITPRRTIMVRSTTCHAGTPCRHLRIRGSLPRIYTKGIGEAPHRRQQMEVVLRCHPKQTSPDSCNARSTRTISEKLWICIVPIANRCSSNHQRQIEVVNRRIYAREPAKTTLTNISTTSLGSRRSGSVRRSNTTSATRMRAYRCRLMRQKRVRRGRERGYLLEERSGEAKVTGARKCEEKMITSDGATRRTR
jgi:hypothetical protein